LFRFFRYIADHNRNDFQGDNEFGLRNLATSVGRRRSDDAFNEAGYFALCSVSWICDLKNTKNLVIVNFSALDYNSDRLSNKLSDGSVAGH
jgi:hypothetical protein